MVAPRKGVLKAPRERYGPASRGHSPERFDRSPSSFVPSRSPDLGSSTFPLTPSIGPGSGLLGPEAGRSPSRLRSGEKEGERRTFGTDRH